MRYFGITKSILLLFALMMAGCTTDDVPNTEIVEYDSSVRTENRYNFSTSLKGENEVQDPAVETRAVGQAIVKISRDETYLEYKLIVANIDDVLASHFHMAPAGSNGGVVAFLFSGPVTNPDGVLAEGVITEDDLIGALAGADFQDLIDAIRAGNIYVNVHSTEYPAGEIRGQL